MEGTNLETLIQVVTIVGGIVALFLALLQIVETYVDIGDTWPHEKGALHHEKCN